MQLKALVNEKLHNFSHFVLNILEYLVFHLVDYNRQAAKKLFEYSIACYGFTLNGPNASDVRVLDERAYAKMISTGMFGVFECYMNKWIDADDDLVGLFFKVSQSKLMVYLLYCHPYNICMGLINSMFDVQTIENSWKDGGEQYDYGAEFYKTSMGPATLCSTGRFSGNCDMGKAEQNQLSHIAKMLKLKPGMTVLDIGCGFGTVAEYLVRNHDVHVTGVTTSNDMVECSTERCKGLNARFLKQDYREIEGKFDRVICIEMSEHVGAHRYRSFLEKCHSLLNDDGLFFLHVVSNNQWYMSKYIGIFEKFLGLRITFPQIKRVINDSFGYFVVEYMENMGYDYGLTWKEWRKIAMENWEHNRVNYDEHFYRKMNLYAVTGICMFGNRKLHAHSIIFSKDGYKGGYKLNE